MSDFQLSLSEYLNTVQEVIRVAFDEPVWVKAEIRNLSIKGGHYYLELAEKEEDTDKELRILNYNWFKKDKNFI